MGWVIHCDCGTSIRGTDEDEPRRERTGPRQEQVCGDRTEQALALTGGVALPSLRIR
jgi:hypothetical protein